MSPDLARAAKISCDASVNVASGNPKNANTKPRDLRRSWLWLSGSALAMAVGFTANVQPDAARWFGFRGPACPLGACLGPIACPGCGLVRSTASALQGDLGTAFCHHPGGLGIALLLPATFAVHFDILRRGRVGAHSRLRRAGYALTSSSILLGWLVRFLL